MFIAKKHIPRRTFLRGAGVALALPLLEAMLPAQTPLSQTAAKVKTRFTGIFHPHGAAPGYWNGTMPNAASVNGNFELGFIHTPLEPFRDHLSIFSGLDSKASMPPPGTSGGDHSRASALLTGTAPKKTSGADIYGGTSIDQMIAKKIGQETLLPSIQIGIEDPGANTGVCGWGYSCAYTNSISWTSPAKPLPMELNPRVVFERMYGDGSSSEQRLARKAQNGSILDSVTHDMARLGNKVAASDRALLNDYFQDIREIERRIQIATTVSAEAPSVDVPFGVPDLFEDHIKLMFDLQALAFHGDISRVSTLMVGRDSSDRTFPESGFNGEWHSSSHHGEAPGRITDYSKMNRYHVRMLAYFVQKLKSTPDGDGTLLDHSLILYGSNMGNSNQHSHVNCPHLLIGGASGRLKGNRHVKAPSGTTASNLLLSILDLYGIELDSIGDSTERLSV